ncbi:bifunctional phosphoribosyl-AMP cyclohydrolase/phosphoribosyl-ATP diphosphatase HisIE [Desulfurispirillum indicum]|uniref:Histidine biosynthesis bifunctional protein HisIE n=1 Tax=Desulfurispirillum indicum (strain ATCC BAA-1389 / DSM 22839 / S5) TaxID=653733 RepID=E6W6Y5_DESIS|nr:bifunctional phosphoribosyl-AMP cyclohydrolase/phosphoribosyl-ATP diphosphatase HisIE [Desulfurispirillum indicum]ADU66228.1 phosphoribosyl-ATP diphosphatase [Desulfurispirillum indicum S5]UCZ55562.1 bifunctional phosphoribosyl-AMP cyclohydrolase/phosphoribosyl-ATP diphosphatase HisIE [Desulfurispirillum indicum]
MVIDDLKFDDRGLLTVIAQDWRTGEVLMVAFANREAVQKTFETGRVHYYSRSRQSLWLKGESSGAFQLVKEIRTDCDRDALLIKIEQLGGGACHTGERSCFFEVMRAGESVFDVLERLEGVIEERRLSTGEKSYVKSLLEKGEDTQLKKVGEESMEFACAVKDRDSARVVAEAADVLFHMAVCMADKGIGLGLIKDELARRFGTGGHEEKAARS